MHDHISLYIVLRLLTRCRLWHLMPYCIWCLMTSGAALLLVLSVNVLWDYVIEIPFYHHFLGVAAESKVENDVTRERKGMIKSLHDKIHCMIKFGVFWLGSDYREACLDFSCVGASPNSICQSRPNFKHRTADDLAFCSSARRDENHLKDLPVFPCTIQEFPDGTRGQRSNWCGS